MRLITTKSSGVEKFKDLRAEADHFDNSSFEIRKERIKSIKDTLNEYLSAIKLTGSSIKECMIMDLMEGEFDVENEVWVMEETSIEIIRAITKKEIAQLIDPGLLQRSVELLYKVNRFASRLKSDYCTAEMHLAFLEYDGTGHMYSSLNVEQEYLLKLKILKAKVA